MRIDLNADVGESFGAYTIGHDRGLMASITSANVAAGLHAGDPSVLRDTIRLAGAHGVAVGAHPGYSDREDEPDGSLASRRKPGAVISDPDTVVARAIRMVRDKAVVAVDGSLLPVEADTICIHSDTPGADALAVRLRAGLENAGITVTS